MCVDGGHVCEANEFNFNFVMFEIPGGGGTYNSNENLGGNV